MPASEAKQGIEETPLAGVKIRRETERETERGKETENETEVRVQVETERLNQLSTKTEEPHKKTIVDSLSGTVVGAVNRKISTTLFDEVPRGMEPKNPMNQSNETQHSDKSLLDRCALRVGEGGSAQERSQQPFAPVLSCRAKGMHQNSQDRKKTDNHEKREKADFGRLGWRYPHEQDTAPHCTLVGSHRAG